MILDRNIGIRDKILQNGFFIAYYLIKCQYKPPEISHINTAIWVDSVEK